MNREKLTGWLDGYKRAWEEANPEGAGALFAEDATYHETPFEAPMEGRPAIVEYWSHVPRVQKDIHFEYDILGLVDGTAFAHWRATFVRVPSGARVELDGMFVLEFDAGGSCTALREWWHRKENGGR